MSKGMNWARATPKRPSESTKGSSLNSLMWAGGGVRFRGKVAKPSSKAELRQMAANAITAAEEKPKPKAEPVRYLINARYAGEDRTGQPVKRGDLIYYYPATREVELYLTVTKPVAKSKRSHRRASSFFERTLQG